MERRIDAPDKVWLTRKQAAAWLNIGVDAFDQLLETLGLDAIDCGPRTKRYSWVLVYALGEIYPLMKGSRAAPGSENKPV